MTSRAPHRRAPASFNAARGAALVLATALLAASCSDDPSAGQRATDLDFATVPDDHGLSATLAAQVVESTVAIDGVACGRLSFGSGFAVSEELVVTNAHVIVGMDPIRVYSLDGEEHTGTAVAFDAVNDLALVQVDGAAFEPLPRATGADNGSVGMLVGWQSSLFPDPTPYRINRAVTVRIDPVGGTEPAERPAYLLAAEVETGDSGAALVNDDGEVVGVVFATSIEEEGVGYAVRASALDALISRSLDPNLSIPDC